MAVMVPKSPQTVDSRYQVSQPQSQVYKLGEILQRLQLISGCQLQLAIQSQSQGSCHRKIGEILIEQRAISPFDLQVALREQSWRQKGYWVID